MALISFEGGEGSGKTALLEMLKEFLEGKGFSVAAAKEPGGVAISEEIREVLLKPRNEPFNPLAELFLYQAARAQFVQAFLKPALARNDYVLLDRYFDSTTAYQGYGRGLNLDLVKALNMAACQGVIPDKTFLLDVSPETGLKRCEKNEFGEPDRLEKEGLEFHKRVRQGYLSLAEEDPERITVLDSENQELYQLFQAVRDEALRLAPL